MKFGVAYYPEHWPEERWAADAQLMSQIGIEVVRIGEFAWWRLEPRRERIDTSWLEEAVKVLRSHDLRVILGTPTAAPPPWLFNRHPNILPQQADGRRWAMGSRRHACLNNPAYTKYVRRIVMELARTFRDGEIWAWQIDNELGLGPTGVCYCDECEKSFRRWLKRRYGTIDRLNRMWGTAFWSQGFSDWHEIPAPRRTVCGPHPSLALDYSRFISAQHRAFVEEQREIIRDYSGGDAPITVNEPSALDLPHLNMFSLASQQDVISLDNYPTDPTRLDQTALGLDMARSLLSRPFWITEQQAGATLVQGHSQQPRPGQLRLWTWQAAARGAELITYFRWRTAPFGQEMHWYGLLDPDGTPRRRMDEVRRTIEEIRDKVHAMDDYEVAAPVAILVDYESAWALDSSSMGWEADYFGHIRTLYGLFRRMGVGVHFVEPDDNLAPFELVISPMQFVCTNALAKKLKVYVHDGGTLLISAPTGYRNPVNTVLESPPPGPLMELLAVEVVEHDVLGEHQSNAVRPLEGNGEFEVDRFCSVLELRGAKKLAVYDRDFYSGSPAFTVRSEGRGKAFFTGAALNEEGLEWVLTTILETTDVQPSEWASQRVEVIPLRGADGRPDRFFVLNHGGDAVELPVADGQTFLDVLTDEEHESQLVLQPYSVALLQR
jgi:beta-galactosidase